MPSPALASSKAVSARYFRSLAASNFELPAVPGAIKQILVAPYGVRSTACPECNRYQPHGRAEQLVGFKMSCYHCEHVDLMRHFLVDLQAGQERYLDDDVVRRAHWYHVSTKENWLATITSTAASRKGSPMVHVGSKEAALDRMIDIGRRPAPVHLYEVHLKAGAEIAPGFFKDEDDRWPKTSYDVSRSARFKSFSASGATRYVNHYEASGTISLIVNCAALELVSHEVISQPAAN